MIEPYVLHDKWRQKFLVRFDSATNVYEAAREVSGSPYCELAIMDSVDEKISEILGHAVTSDRVARGVTTSVGIANWAPRRHQAQAATAQRVCTQENQSARS